MEDKDFSKYLLLVVGVVAVVGLLSSGALDFTGFAAKKVSSKKAMAKTVSLKAKQPTTCVDSDGGRNYDVLGRITGVAKTGRQYNIADRCANDGRLWERYCSRNVAKTDIHVCGDGKVCEGGVCVEAAVEPFCRHEGNNVVTNEGTQPRYECDGSFSISRRCTYNRGNILPVIETRGDCGWEGCDEQHGICTWVLRGDWEQYPDVWGNSQ